MLLRAHAVNMAVEYVSRYTILLLSLTSLWFLYTPLLRIMGVGMSVEPQKWQEIAAAKRSENLVKIPSEWRLDDSVIADGRKQKQLAGAFIESLLDQETLTITSLEVDEMLRQVKNGSLTSVQVTQAFCKRGAFAHQLVRRTSASRFFCADSAL